MYSLCDNVLCESFERLTNSGVATTENGTSQTGAQVNPGILLE
jgi:hypothetical protein